MTYASQLSIEIVVVGLAFAFLTVCLHALEMGADEVIAPGSSTAERSHNEMMIRMVLRAFAAGALGHVAFELLGTNKWYCKNGAACMQ